MEASVAAAPGTGDGAGEGQQQQQQSGEQQGQQPTGDAALAQLAEGLQTQGESLEQMREFLASNPWTPPPAAEAPAPPDLSALSDPNVTPEQAAEQLAKVMDERATEKAQELVKPLMDQVGEIRAEREVDTLVTEFPELGEPETAKAVLSYAEDAAKLVGNPELATNVQFIRQCYMAGRAAQLAQQQRGAGPSNAATLEGAGGASPGGATQGTPEQQAEAIGEKWGARRSVLPF